MPFEGTHENDVGLELPDGPVCSFDSENGAVKASEAIFEGGVAFFMEAATGGDRELAARLTRRNMNSLPYWQVRLFASLSGDPASDEEFDTAMAKL
ncbi:hypothetical protein EBS80_02065 [bacterium]|nr:hypothetical protein [bacterium]